jgi:hypothetical protein
MAFRHPRDPEVQWAAAATFGKAVALGLIEAEDAVGGLAEAAVKAGFQGDVAGLHARLTWHINDIAGHWRRERDRTEFLIRREVQAMLGNLTEVGAILATAFGLNERQGEPLLAREVRGLVETETAAFISVLRRQLPQPRRRRHVR